MTSHNDLSSCNCCPKVNPCVCHSFAAPCCWTMSGYTHCSFTPAPTLCRWSYGHSFGDRGYDPYIIPCLWLSEATWVLVESGTYFPVENRLFWALVHLANGYSLILCVNNKVGSTIYNLELLELARWMPSSGRLWDPVFDTSPETFNFDRLMLFANDFPSVINCTYPKACGESQVADGSNLPQTITLTPSCFNSADPCEAACEQPYPLPTDESGCGNCSSEGFCTDGETPANCTWEWNSGLETFEVTSDDCSDSPTSGCNCVAMCDGCLTADPGTPTTITGPCHDGAKFSEGVRICDP